MCAEGNLCGLHAAALPNLAHHGMIYVPAGYSFGAPLYGLDEVRGGSGWGAGTFAGGDGSRQPTKTELDFAEHQVRVCSFLHEHVAETNSGACSPTQQSMHWASRMPWNGSHMCI